jgi:hypothetical protein
MNEAIAHKNKTVSKSEPEVQHYLAMIEDVINIALNPDSGAAVNSLDLHLNSGASIVIPSDFLHYG